MIGCIFKPKETLPAKPAGWEVKDVVGPRTFMSYRSSVDAKPWSVHMRLKDTQLEVKEYGATMEAAYQAAVEAAAGIEKRHLEILSSRTCCTCKCKEAK